MHPYTRPPRAAKRAIEEAIPLLKRPFMPVGPAKAARRAESWLLTPVGAMFNDMSYRKIDLYGCETEAISYEQSLSLSISRRYLFLYTLESAPAKPLCKLDV